VKLRTFGKLLPGTVIECRNSYGGPTRHTVVETQMDATPCPGVKEQKVVATASYNSRHGGTTTFSVRDAPRLKRVRTPRRRQRS